MKMWKKFSILAAVVLLMVTWRPAWAIVVNALYDFVQVSAPSNPASGNSRVYVDSGTHKLSCLNSDGSSCAPTGGGGGSFITPLTAPVAGNFTALNYNVGTGVTTTQTNNTSPVTSITIQQLDPNITQNIVGLVKNKLAATFTATVAYSLGGGAIPGCASQSLAGIWITDGGNPPNNIIWSLQASQNGFRGPMFSDFTTFAGDIISQFYQSPWPVGGLLYMRIQETASARIYSFSSDGIVFNTVRTESNTANFTTAQYGWAIEDRQCFAPISMTVYSFTETNP
jgi:hypothetical protein